MLVGDFSGYAIQDLIVYFSMIVIWALGFQSGLHR